ncbi:hypothetical protein GCM10020221_25060 [Streptomyces thioluteus]|uniref:Uncharacterized protein n=1 Tax=Streptomyces thioluteus TaxID=66431 RepID=A0ABN3WU61_STRTU
MPTAPWVPCMPIMSIGMSIGMLSDPDMPAMPEWPDMPASATGDDPHTHAERGRSVAPTPWRRPPRGTRSAPG